MAKTTSLRETVTSLFGGGEDEVAPLSIARLRAVEPDAVPQAVSPSGLDLSGQHRVILPMAAGRSGKTLLCRWMIERAMQRGDNPTLATADAARPALKLYFPEVISAPLETLFPRLLKSPRTLVVDMGADMTLAPVLAQVPTLQELMVSVGLSPVPLYLLTPRSLDLTVLDAMEHLKFCPPATALILNIGCTTTADPAAEFRQIRRHPTYQAALDRGAVEIWMPRLYAAKTIEDRAMALYRAADPAGGLDVFDQARTFHWLGEMERAFGAVLTWLP